MNSAKSSEFSSTLGHNPFDFMFVIIFHEDNIYNATIHNIR